MGKKKTSQRKQFGGQTNAASKSRDEMERYIPFSRHHGDDPDLEDRDHGSGFASAANVHLLASYPLKVKTVGPYRTLGNDLIQAAVHLGHVVGQSICEESGDQEV